MSAPDFEALRAARNIEHAAFVEKMKAEGWNISGCMHNDPNACFCNCGYTKGLDDPEHACEHKWDGEGYEDETLSSTTCSRCGMLSYSHSLRMGM